MNRRTKTLVGLHLVALPLLLFIASRQTWPQLMRPFCFGLALSQCGLLAVWAAFGQGWPRFRTAVAAVGVSCIAAATTFALDREPERAATNASLVALIMLTAGIVFLGLLGMRIRQGLTLFQRPPPLAISADWQFSLTHIFMAMAVIAGLLSFQKAFDGVDFREHGLRSVLFWAATVPSAVVLQWASLWATLGLRHTLIKVMILLPTGPLSGLVPPLQITGSFDGRVYTFWTAVFSCQVLISLSTLLVLRSRGLNCTESGA